jgi:hypothetical protein
MTTHSYRHQGFRINVTEQAHGFVFRIYAPSKRDAFIPMPKQKAATESEARAAAILCVEEYLKKYPLAKRARAKKNPAEAGLIT